MEKNTKRLGGIMVKSLGLCDVWHEYNEDNVKNLLALNKFGNYALGYPKPNTDGKIYYVSYVGRSDSCIQGRLLAHEHLEHDECTHFKFNYASSKQEAYEKECSNYHDFSPKLNEIHPDISTGSKLKCPISPCK